MAVFVITTVAPNPRVKAAVELQFPGKHYAFSGTTFFVEASGSAADVGTAVGVKGRVEGQPFDGVTDITVNKLTSSYWGFHSKDLWDWLRSAFERDT